MYYTKKKKRRTCRKKRSVRAAAAFSERSASAVAEHHHHRLRVLRGRRVVHVLDNPENRRQVPGDDQQELHYRQLRLREVDRLLQG